LKEARKVYGFFSFLRRIIKNFSEKAAPITEVPKTTVPFHWYEKQSDCLKSLKKDLTSAPPLKIYDSSHKSIVKTDASKIGVGAKIYQFCPIFKKYLPVAFASRLMTPTEERISPSMLYELVGVTFATQTFRHYLAGIPCDLYCDYKALVQVLNNKTSSLSPDMHPKVPILLMHLQGHTFTAHWKPNDKMVDVDFLSRFPLTDETNEKLTTEDWIAPILIDPNYPTDSKDEILQVTTRAQNLRSSTRSTPTDDHARCDSTLGTHINDEYDSDDDIPLAKFVQGADSTADDFQNNNIPPDNLPTSKLLTEQLKDPYLHKIYLHLNGTKPIPNLINEPYELRDGLIKIPRQSKYLIVIPSHLRDPVIKHYHDSSYALHGGIT